MHHEILEVTPGASLDVIRKQYRRLSLVHHPDRKGGDATKFRQLTQAYESLLAESPSAAASPAPTPAAGATLFPLEITLEQAYSGSSVPVHVGGETIYVDIPPGIDTNEILAVRPDVRVKVTVLNTTRLVRNGLELTYTHRISLKDALCGTVFEIQYFQGQTLRLSTHGTIVSPKYTKVLPLKGMRRNTNCGSLTIAFDVEFPQTLTINQMTDLKTLL